MKRDGAREPPAHFGGLVVGGGDVACSFGQPRDSVGGEDGETLDTDDGMRDDWLRRNQEMVGDGLRVLAVAERQSRTRARIRTTG